MWMHLRASSDLVILSRTKKTSQSPGVARGGTWHRTALNLQAETPRSPGTTALSPPRLQLCQQGALAMSWYELNNQSDK